jgi:L-alanine-DL-glutamate epimerase-like enolase superfamily enzyme
MANKALRLFNIVVFIFLSHSTASHGGESVLENSFWGIAAKAAGVSAYDLYGIALQETKMRWGDGSVRPWPWTLVLNGPKAKSLRYGSKEETARALASFVAHGITNIDIGLMQVNWKYNGHKYVRSATDLVDL